MLGFDILNTVGSLFMVGTMAVQPQIVVLNDGDVALPDTLQVVKKVQFTRYRDDLDPACRLQGVLIAYDRPTDETRMDGSVLPAAPGKIQGYAMVLHTLACPGKPDQPVAYVTDYFGGLFGVMTDKLKRDAMDLTKLKDFARPAWLATVTPRLQDLGETEAVRAATTPATPEPLNDPDH